MFGADLVEQVFAGVYDLVVDDGFLVVSTRSEDSFDEEPEDVDADLADPIDVPAMTANPLFGMWRNREDLADVVGYVRDLRQPRFSPDGTPHVD